MGNVIETNADLATETLVAIGFAGRMFPHPVGRTALERWMRHGVRGVRLESILVGTRRFTSVEAIARFIEESNRQQDTKGRTRMSPAELHAKKRELGLND